MVHRIKEAIKAAEKELNETDHALSRFGSFEINAESQMKQGGWLFHLKSESKPPINKASKELIRRIFSRHLQDQGIEVAIEQSVLDQRLYAELHCGSVVDHWPGENKLRPYNWCWVFHLFKAKRKD